MATRFVRINEACARLGGIGRSTLYRGVGDWLPPLYKIVGGSQRAPSGFIEEEFEAALRKRIDAQKAERAEVAE